MLALHACAWATASQTATLLVLPVVALGCAALAVPRSPRPAVPVLLAGHGVTTTSQQRYSEAAAEGTPVVIGQRLMEPFLSQPKITWDAAFADEANRGEAALDGELEADFERVSGGMRG